eukprot:sb/3475567/
MAWLPGCHGDNVCHFVSVEVEGERELAVEVAAMNRRYEPNSAKSSAQGRQLSDLKIKLVKRSSQTDFRGQSYRHRRILDRKVIFDCSELRQHSGQTRAWHSLQSPRCGVARQRKRGDCSAFQPNL